MMASVRLLVRAGPWIACLAMSAGRAMADDPPPPPPPDTSHHEDPAAAPTPTQDSAPAQPIEAARTPKPPPALAKSAEPPPASAGTAAPWLHPWLGASLPDTDPVLASGQEASLEIAGGSILSTFSMASPTFSETGEYGHYVASSTKQALSIEVIEKLNVVMDHVTPEFGMIGGGLRRIGRRNVDRFHAIDFERVSVGLAAMSRGSNLDTGLGAGAAFGFMTFGGSGLAVSVDAYLFDARDIAGPNKLIVISLGYVYSPITGARAGTPPAEWTPPPRRESTRPACGNAKAFEGALIKYRKRAVDVCNKGPSTECNTEKDIVIRLNANLSACLEGDDVGFPPEVDDAPAR
jgi:hypothetical protein